MHELIRNIFILNGTWPIDAIDAVDSQIRNVPFANSFAWLTHILPYPSIRCIDCFHRFVLFLFFCLENRSVTGARIFWCSLLPPSLSTTSERFRSFIQSNVFEMHPPFTLNSRATILYCRVNSRSFGDLLPPKQ